jgi:hypothetical protein
MTLGSTARRSVAAVMLLAVLLVVAGAGLAQDETRPVAVFSELTFDFGDVFEQPKYVHVFKVRNQGKSDLLIEEVKPG